MSNKEQGILNFEVFVLNRDFSAGK